MTPNQIIAPFADLLCRQGVVVLDGGLATELERRGCDLDHPLWSARLLLDEPTRIRDVHLAYLYAGADCILTASYQASIAGLLAQGLDEVQALAVVRRSVQLALDARDAFWGDPANRCGRARPLVAASIGPYGAYLADGSEYSGRYGRSVAELSAFHRRRWQVLAAAGADLLACETIPSRLEVAALARLMIETPQVPVWISITCSDGRHLRDGSALADALAPLQGLAQVVAIGVNCTAPRFVPALLAELRRRTDRALVVYPNAAEHWDAGERTWTGRLDPDAFAAAAHTWRRAGATLIGGCCGSDPRHIAALRARLCSNEP